MIVIQAENKDIIIDPKGIFVDEDFEGKWHIYATGANVGRVRVRLTHKNYTDAELNVWLHQIYKEMKQQGSTVYIDIWDIIRRGKR